MERRDRDLMIEEEIKEREVEMFQTQPTTKLKLKRELKIKLKSKFKRKSNRYLNTQYSQYIIYFPRLYFMDK